jgi:hypothetical protein
MIPTRSPIVDSERFEPSPKDQRRGGHVAQWREVRLLETIEWAGQSGQGSTLADCKPYHLRPAIDAGHIFIVNSTGCQWPSERLVISDAHSRLKGFDRPGGQRGVLAALHGPHHAEYPRHGSFRVKGGVRGDRAHDLRSTRRDRHAACPRPHWRKFASTNPL